MKKPLGLTLYQGPSLLDGEDISVTLTGLQRSSKNDKLGNMLQCWILRSDTNPVDSFREGKDKSVCGNCKHRHFRSCYVTLHQGPFNVYKASKKGRYAEAALRHMEFIRDKMIRLGAYGDPAAVPIHIWKFICSVTKKWTGYTHSWKTADKELKHYCMASCDTPEEREEAKSRGWRTFRCRTEDEPVLPGEIVCPASVEGGKKSNCADCGLCNGIKKMGSKKDPRKDITMIAHGGGAQAWRARNFKRGIELMKKGEDIEGIWRKWHK
jgi:hypothetical protein